MWIAMTFAYCDMHQRMVDKNRCGTVFNIQECK